MSQKYKSTKLSELIKLQKFTSKTITHTVEALTFKPEVCVSHTLAHT